eukprot:scaffold877_cov154-Amphora_coffeaeformis.AAC.2
MATLSGPYKTTIEHRVDATSATKEYSQNRQRIKQESKTPPPRDQRHPLSSTGFALGVSGGGLVTPKAAFMGVQKRATFVYCQCNCSYGRALAIVE